MITAEDIEAFRDANEEHEKTADEYARRWRKGLPSDRWCDGSQGAASVAMGIAAKNAKITMLTEALVRLWNEKQEAGNLAMEASKDPCRED